jgi:hypothetical protein
MLTQASLCPVQLRFPLPEECERREKADLAHGMSSLLMELVAEQSSCNVTCISRTPIQKQPQQRN